MAGKITEQQKVDWQQHFIAQKQSGLSRAEYCRINNLSYDNFYYHHKRYQEARSVPNNLKKGDKKQQSNDFISLVVKPTSDTPKKTSPVELSLQCRGDTLSVKANWTTDELISFVSSWKAV